MPQNYSINILVIDDELFMLKLICEMLNKLGCKNITSFDNGRSALELFTNESNHPDLILLDINMPEMDGIEFLRHLEKSFYKGSILLISGENERMMQSAEQLVKNHNISTIGYIKKPFGPNDLAVHLEKWTRKQDQVARKAKKIYNSTEIYSAIYNDEMINFYQPKVDVTNGTVIGVESLVRWKHPDDGLVFPDQFIETAEEFNLIGSLTKKVLQNAFIQSQAWESEKLKLNIAINISMDDLSSYTFVDLIGELANAHAISPENITLEVTESRLMKELSTPQEVLTRLRLKRYGLSIDDFGTGHSSLGQLRNFPFSELKIDQSFVHGAAKNETLKAIFNSSLGLAQQLDMKTVAEGVEDLEDWEFVKNSGCDLAQGYFIARPMPANEVPQWLTKWKNEYANL